MGNMEASEKVEENIELEDEQVESVAGGISMERKAICACCGNEVPEAMLYYSSLRPGFCPECMKRIKERPDYRPEIQ